MAFFNPKEDGASRTASLQLRSGSIWESVAESEIEPLSSAALFRVDNWDSDVNRDYRVTYRWNSLQGPQLATWEGTIRKDPSEKSPS